MKLVPVAAFATLAAALACPAAPAPVSPLEQGFDTPAAETRPMVRWWWFGPAVVPTELAHEMQLMKEGGFGGFEVQPTYPLALDGQYPGLRNIKFLSPEFFKLLGYTAAEAKAAGLRMDLTLGSGWPYGGPMFNREEAAQSIADAGTVPIPAGATSVTAPQLHNRGSVPDAPVVAALLGPVQDPAPGASPYIVLPVRDRTAQLPSDLHGASQVRFFVYAPAGLMQVKRAAYGAEGFIIDHYNPSAIDKFIDAIALPELNACGPNAPYSVFCDSLEIAGEGWTPDMPAEFKRRRGYDLLPLLPALFDPTFPRGAEIRGDYGRTVAEVFDDVFVARFTKLAHEHQSRFRLQAYGTPPTTLSTYARVDIDEGENYSWRLFSGTRWAASASHLLGRPEVSSEAFTWLHSPVFMAAPIDIKAESNLQFLNGVNHLLFHGWPYTAPGVEYPGWRFYAAAVFNEKNPWWIVMPDITRYLARTSFLLRQGTPANDVALYLPEEDAFSEMTPRNLQMVQAGGNGILNRLVNALVPRILDAGFNFDGVDAGILAQRGTVDGPTLAFGDVKYRAVILPEMTRIEPASLRRLESFANAGGILIAIGHPPISAPGYLARPEDQQLVRQISERLFLQPGAKGIVIPAERLAATLAEKLKPDVVFAEPQPNVGFIHRHLPDADVYFLANTSNQPVSTSARFRRTAGAVEWWDADTGKKTAAHVQSVDGTSSVPVELPPYGACFLVFSDRSSATPSEPAPEAGRTIDLSRDWNVSFKNAAPEPHPAPEHFDTLASWTDRPATHFFSGVATYEKKLDVPATLVRPGATVMLDFGTGQPVNVAGGMGMRANFQPPVGDAAVVYINGSRAGSVWCPPYRVDVTRLIHVGANEIRIEVANRAINFMADLEHHPLPDYTALNANREFGGRRFDPQDMRRIQITPSGLLDRVQLIAAGGE
jgi:hypothetical protein